MEMTRRTVILSGVAAGLVAALPVYASTAAPMPPMVADMFYTEDEPWGAFVRSHVPKEQFDKAVLHMIETNSDHRENGEDWLFEYHYADDDERITIIAGDPEYTHMRVDYVCPDRGEQYVFCKAGDDGAIPITVVRY